MKKNQIIELEITDITSDGNGVGRYESMAVFVPETAVGDLLKVKIVKVLKSYCFGIVDEIISPSPDRVQTDCPHFPKCGGCSFRHISYESEAKLKEKFVYDAFTRIGKIQTEFMPILSCEASYRYRNKAQYHVFISDDGNICGFYAKRSHRIMSGYDCRLLPENFGEISRFITEYTNENNITGYDE
ncbi:MAG: class I SAM-dependent RNA methyltransferase, partial [Oscillospiraceae bacterium]|nr:class I SAM-dependent RNA methyltransferase [Oscillospiraceae bacterium]